MPELLVRTQRLVRVRVGDLVPAEWNFREHGQRQKDAFDKTVGELGFYGYPDVFEADDGTLVLVDGHLRREWLIDKHGEDAEIEVNCVDFTEEEARLATATHDPVSEMARTNYDKLQGLLKSLPRLAFHKPPLPPIPERPSVAVQSAEKRVSDAKLTATAAQPARPQQRFPVGITVTRETRDRWEAWKQERELESDSEAFECLLNEVDS